MAESKKFRSPKPLQFGDRPLQFGDRPLQFGDRPLQFGDKPLQFGDRPLQFGDKPSGSGPGDSGHCAQCEAMLADALDGTLSTTDQELFDSHMENCGPCAQLLADAKRGAAWLEMLRDPSPEPPAMLLERILAQTSGIAGHTAPVPIAMSHSGMAVAGAATPGGIVESPGYNVAAYRNVVPFRNRLRASSFGQIVLQPRLAMTAAMAFFSIALTMNLTGIHAMSLRASDLTPGSLKRDVSLANASVVRYYEGLRVVYELESRVHEFESTADIDTAVPPSGQSPAAQPGQATPQSEPRSPSQTGPQSGPQSGPQTGPQSGDEQRQHKRAAPRPGTSQREGLNPGRRVVAVNADSDAGETLEGDSSLGSSLRVRSERKVA